MDQILQKITVSVLYPEAVLKRLTQEELEFIKHLTGHSDIRMNLFKFYYDNKRNLNVNLFCPICNKEILYKNRKYLLHRDFCCSNKCQTILTGKTNLERFGTKCQLNHPEVKEKQIKTLKKKYGKDIINIFQVESIKEKCRNTCLQNHGVVNIYQRPDIRQKARKNSRNSKVQLEVLNFVKQCYSGDVKNNCWSVLKNQEIDIYIPDLKLGIEVNGQYYHQIDHKQTNKDYHLNKTNLCESKGIRLIHIWEHEWKNNQEFCKEIIRQYLNGKIPLDLFQDKARLPRDYFQRLDFPGYGVIPPTEEYSIKFYRIYKTGYLLNDD